MLSSHSAKLFAIELSSCDFVVVVRNDFISDFSSWYVQDWIVVF